MIHDLPDGAIPMTGVFSQPAVYLFLKDNNVIYVGQTNNLSRRLVAHSKLKTKSDTIFFLPATEDSQIRKQQEAILINRYNPIHNYPVRRETETHEEFIVRKLVFRKRYIMNKTAGFQLRIDDDLVAIIVESARVNFRSVPGEANYILRQHYGAGPRPARTRKPWTRTKKQSS